MTRATLCLALLALCSTPALAAPTAVEARSPAPTLDVEVDPVAYALGGHSVHAGLRVGAWRFDLGAFAIEVPDNVHGDERFTLYSGGYGLKLDYRPVRGLVLGTQVNIVRDQIRHRETAITQVDHYVSVGVRAGYQIDVGGGFYVLPWLGVDGVLSDRVTRIAGDAFDAGRLIVFPTVHLGYVL